MAALREVITETGALAHVEALIDALTDQAFRALEPPTSSAGPDVLRGLAVAATSRSV